jgi:hypothetical protein
MNELRILSAEHGGDPFHALSLLMSCCLPRSLRRVSVQGWDDAHLVKAKSSLVLRCVSHNDEHQAIKTGSGPCPI